MKRIVPITLYGRRFEIETVEDESYVKRVVDFFKKRVEEIGSKRGSLNTYDDIILAGFQLSAELLELKEENNKLLKKVEEKIDEFIMLINDNIRT